MSNHDLRVVLTADDQNRIEKELAELPESSDGARTISVFLPGASQVLMLHTEDGAISRASQADRLRRNDTYPGEWECGGV